MIILQEPLEEVPDFGGLLPKAYERGVPVFELTDEEIGESGHVLTGLKSKRDQLRTQFEKVVEQLLTLLQND